MSDPVLWEILEGVRELLNGIGMACDEQQVLEISKITYEIRVVQQKL